MAESAAPFVSFSRADAAKMLGVSMATIDRLRREGKLSGRKIGRQVRFISGDIEAFLARNIEQKAMH